ncbi:hypothetical protein JCM14076_23780 [Methylosoma difficile]
MSDFWKGFLSVILILAFVVVYSEIKEQKSSEETAQTSVVLDDTPKPQPAEVKSVVEILIGKETVTIREEDVKELQNKTNLKLSELKQNAISNLNNTINQRVDSIFLETSKNIKNYSDWYYSLSGDYARTYESIKGDGNAFLIDKMQEIIYQPTAFDYKLNAFQQEMDQISSDQIQQAKVYAAQQIGEFLVNHKVTVKKNTPIKSKIDLSESFKKAFSITPESIAQHSAIKFAGIAIAGFALKVLATKLLAKKTFQVAAALLAKLLIKKGGGGLVAAGAGTLACAPAGPAALLCGAAAGLFAWVAVDEISIKVDEHFHRQEFEMEIQQALTEQSDEIKTKLKSVYEDVLNQNFIEINNQISKSFNQKV